MKRARVESVVVVGLGSAGKRHVAVLRELRPGLNIVALRRPDGPVNPAVDATVHSVEEALGHDPDVAVIAGPSTHRVADAVLFAEAGVHLLLEKPVSTSARDADALVTVARERGIMVAVGYNLRFLGLLRRTREALERQSCGPAVYLRVEVGQHLASWRPGRDHRDTVTASRTLGGGALLELSHEIDYASWLMGPAKTVTAECRRLSDLTIDVEDAAELMVTFANGALGSVHMDMVRQPPVRRFSVICQDGTIEGNLLEGRLDVWHHDAEGPSSEDFDVAIADTYRLQMQDVLTAVERDSQPAIGLDDGLKVLRIVDAAREAADTGRRTIVAPARSKDHEQ